MMESYVRARILFKTLMERALLDDFLDGSLRRYRLCVFLSLRCDLA
jgi:hypothetical protein